MATSEPTAQPAGVDAPACGRALYDALRNRAPIEPFTDTEPGLTADDGYAIQQELVRLLLADGDGVVGYKLGLTSKPMQEMMGVDTPDYGPVLRSFLHPDGAELSLDRLIAPRAEAEIVFVLGEAIRGPGVTVWDVHRATAGVAAAIEVVDSRIRDWRIKLPDTIADLASCGGAAISGRLVGLDGLDPRLLGMVLTRNGTLVDTGAGAAALGDPAAAVAWLANTLAPSGVTLEPGHVVMTGALHRAVPLERGDVFRADFDRLGPVTVRIV